jgi:stage V sporulation protein G
MGIDVRVRLVGGEAAKLKAFCSITVGGQIVIRDVKVIGGPNGLFVAMPSRRLSELCPHCGAKNHLRANYCNECGAKLRDPRGTPVGHREALYADVAYAVDARSRESIQRLVLEAYRREVAKAAQLGIKPQPYTGGVPDGFIPGSQEVEEDQHHFGEGILP